MAITFLLLLLLYSFHFSLFYYQNFLANKHWSAKSSPLIFTNSFWFYGSTKKRNQILFFSFFFFLHLLSLNLVFYFFNHLCAVFVWQVFLQFQLTSEAKLLSSWSLQYRVASFFFVIVLHTFGLGRPTLLFPGFPSKSTRKIHSNTTKTSSKFFFFWKWKHFFPATKELY